MIDSGLSPLHADSSAVSLAAGSAELLTRADLVFLALEADELEVTVRSSLQILLLDCD